MVVGSRNFEILRMPDAGKTVKDDAINVTKRRKLRVLFTSAVVVASHI